MLKGRLGFCSSALSCFGTLYDFKVENTFLSIFFCVCVCESNWHLCFKYTENSPGHEGHKSFGALFSKGALEGTIGSIWGARVFSSYSSSAQMPKVMGKVE